MKSPLKIVKENKRNYTIPQITRIKLDKEISLVMQSDAPGDPGGSLQPDHFSINPFKLMKV